MKTFIFSLILVFGMSTLQAQKVIKLDAAHVTFTAPKVVTSSNLQDLNFEVKEAYENQFMKDPIGFAQQNFDIKSLILDDDIESIEVSFLTSKGHLNATYNKKGELVKTSQRFRDIVLPLKVRRDIYKDNIGWSMVSNLYKASGKGSQIDKELYTFKFIQGKQNKYVKYVPQPMNGRKVAGL